MICKYCGTENKDTAKFCNSCGNRIEIIQPKTNLDTEPKHNYCPECGTDNDPTASFCMRCGAKMDGVDFQESYYDPEQQGNYYGSDLQEDYYGPEQQGEYYEPQQDQYYYGSQQQEQYRGPQPEEQYGSQQDQYYEQRPMPPIKSKVAAGVLGILLGGLGIHKFYLGYTKEGLIMLLVSVLTFGIGGVVMGIIGLVEGVIYLTTDDRDFYDLYIYGHKGWF